MLLVAVGGAGRHIATLFKAKLIGKFGHLPENIKIIALDSDDGPTVCKDRNSGSVAELQRGSEFVKLDKVPLDHISRNPERFGELVERVGLDKLRIARFMRLGAVSRRTSGMFSIIWNASQLERVFHDSLRQLTDVESIQDLRLNGLEILLVNSTSGGQGSGAVFDVAYIIQSILSNMGSIYDTRFRGVFLLPDTLPQGNSNEAGANTYAFFRELDKLMSGQTFEARYPGGLHIESIDPPFDDVYVFDGINEHGQHIAGHGEIYEFVTCLLMTKFTTPVGMLMDSVLINISRDFVGQSVNGYGTYLSTFGQAIIRYPAKQISEACAARLAHSIIAAEMLKMSSQDHLLSENVSALNEAQKSLIQAIALLKDTEERSMSIASSSFEVYLTTSDLLDRLYHDYVEPQNAEALSAIVGQTGGLKNWLHISSEELAQQLLHAVDHFVEPLRRLAIEDVLQLEWGAHAAENSIMQLETLAAAQWNLPETKQMIQTGKIGNLFIVGVPDASRSLLVNSRRYLVSTHDLESIIALSIAFGGSFDMFEPSDRWQQAYERDKDQSSRNVLRNS